MCSSYSGPSGTGIQAFFKDKVGKKSPDGSGITTAGGSGPSAINATATAYFRKKAGAPLLDSMFGSIQNG